MKRYELLLQGGVKLIISEEEKTALYKGMESKDSDIIIGNNRFKSSLIKGIFEIKEEVGDNKEVWLAINKDWNIACHLLNKKTATQKTEYELITRIFPGLELNRIKLTDAEIAVMQNNIQHFFETNPEYPRCPMRVWWVFIADRIAPANKVEVKDYNGKVVEVKEKRGNPNLFMGKWWDFVSRNDNAIEEWLRYNKKPQNLL